MITVILIAQDTVKWTPIAIQLTKYLKLTICDVSTTGAEGDSTYQTMCLPFGKVSTLMPITF